MNACPHCGANAISFWKKQILGPGRSTQCRHCAKKIGVDAMRAWVCLSPIIIGGVVGTAVFHSGIGWLAGYAISAPLYHFYVPLVAAES